MKARKLIYSVLLGISLVAIPSVIGGGVTVLRGNYIEAHAESGLEDDVNGSRSSVKDNGVADFFKNHEAMTSDQLNTAAEKVSPFTNVIGYVMGGIIALTTSGIFLITAADLAYIAIPFIRGLLYNGGEASQGASMGMAGMGMGRMGGYGMGGMQQQQSQAKPRQLVSDEAIKCVALSTPQQSSMGMAGMGMGGMQQQQPQVSTKSVVLEYLKKRTFFLIIFTICSIMLTSSIFIGTGINLAQWGMKLMEMINSSIPR